jgi:predicted RNase H-like HicB family nuclease
LPGCVAIGNTIEKTEREIPEVIEFYIEGLIQDDLPVEPASIVQYIEIAA